jgi:VCBS repeat-containing protein
VLANDGDPDVGDALTVTAVRFGEQSAAVGTVLNGAYGALTSDAAGAFSYVLNNGNAAVQALAGPADTLTEVFHYTVADAAGATSTAALTVTIRGANDAPVVDLDTSSDGTGFSTGFAERGAPVPVVGDSLAVTDVDDVSLQSAVVRITNAKAGDQLGISDPAALSALGVSAVVGANGTLTLSGAASVSDYVKALKLVVFANGLDRPDSTTREIVITVNDGETDSAQVTTLVRVALKLDLTGTPVRIAWKAIWPTTGSAASMVRTPSSEGAGRTGSTAAPERIAWSAAPATTPTSSTMPETRWSRPRARVSTRCSPRSPTRSPPTSSGCT